MRKEVTALRSPSEFQEEGRALNLGLFITILTASSYSQVPVL